MNNLEAVVQRQFEAFNSRNLEGLLETYSDGAQLFQHPSKLLAQGKVELRQYFSPRLSDSTLVATLLNRIIIGDLVIDYEKVARNFPEGRGEVELVMIYEIKNAHIANAWVIPGPRRI